MTITVSTDGSALGNPNGPMGWAWADHEAHAGGRPGHEHGGDCDAGGATNGTNQIGELCAVLEALRSHPGAEPLVIETDSQYAINCSTKWVHGWKKNGWKNAQKKPVKNAALIKAIDAELSRRAGSVKFVWVKGHAGNAGNEKVDELARTYAGDCRSGVRDGYLPKEGWESLLASEYAKGTDVPADARMLMDGLISAKDYHLGRGEDTGDGGDVIGRDERAVRSDVEDFSAPLRSGRNDSKRAGGFGRNDSEQSVDVPSPTVISSERSESRNLSGTSTPSLSSAHSTEPSSQQPPATQSASSQPSAAPSSQSVAQSSLPQQSRPSGLAVSGTLRFTPPPSSSPTYDGQPRMISGYVMIDGYVNGDGTITIDSAPFLVRQ
ncbi:ribonuclease H [Bifidobacterium sp. SO1]|uniref:ribonuclease H family protein n=1 Tax=Bifidobacterium sp. SO1 TaxID=2809029 RepID=UPI001BDD3D1B|nr:ribonuclease H [Bifidobacterium sp. SO1]MBT1160478.1 ribonuclease HI [Bifidobacterium sp. SO1]